MKKISVIGGGSWATAIAKILLEKNETIGWWVREPEIRQGLQSQGRNPLYLQGVAFDPSRLRVTGDIEQAVEEADTVVLVVPAVYLPSALSPLTPPNLQDKKICSAVKGIIPAADPTRGSAADPAPAAPAPTRGQVVCEYLRDAFSVPEQNMAVISGPSHAEEIALGRLTYLTAASPNRDLAGETAQMFACDYVQTRLSSDLYGIEYSAVLKNVYALSVGIAKGLGYGDNFVAVLVSNVLNEMRHFLQTACPCPGERNPATAPYLGDLLVTSYSPFSRNRTFGNMIGQGYSVKSAVLEMKMVAEGYYAAGSLMPGISRLQLEMPVFRAVHDILYHAVPPRTAFKQLEKIFK